MVVGRRFDIVSPTNIAYHADHLAIVQNNFPAIIRVGDGDEVRDVPHPLSLAGRDAYDYAVADSLSIRVAARSWEVIAVEFRPRDDRLPRAVGAVYLDRETASVVRLSVTFTRAALIDPALEDVSIVLDNGLVDGRFWLPRRQEIEIRRTGEWLQFPARGIIRGEWDLCCVAANRGLPPQLFVGPEITFAPQSALAAYPFKGRLEDSIAARATGAGPDRQATLVQQRAAELVRRAALERARRATLAVQGVSDFVRVNRVEGLAVGTGASLPLPRGLSIRGDVRYGFDDRLVKYHALLAIPAGAKTSVLIGPFDEYRAAGDTPEASTLGNSIAAQEFGADVTDDYRVSGVAATVEAGHTVRWRASLERVRESVLTVHASPYSGTYRPAFAAADITANQLRIGALAHDVAGPFGSVLDWNATVSASAPDRQGAAHRATYGRASVELRAQHGAGPGEAELSVLGAATSGGNVPSQASVLLGGPVTAPGYAVHTLRGQTGVSARAEWRVPAATFPLSLGRYGSTHVGVTLAPFAGISRANGSVASAAVAGWRRFAGVGLITLYDALRIDVARGMDAGGAWALRVDFGRAFWPVL